MSLEGGKCYFKVERLSNDSTFLKITSTVSKFSAIEEESNLGRSCKHNSSGMVED